MQSHRQTGEAKQPDVARQSSTHRSQTMNVVHAAQAGQGGLVTIACINKATVDLGVPFDKLTATLQKCYDQYFLPIWGYPVRLYNTKTAKPSDWQFVYFDDADT